MSATGFVEEKYAVKHHILLIHSILKLFKMKNKLHIDELDIAGFGESVLGINSPDPLQFSFQSKTSAHVGGKIERVSESEQLSIFQSALQKTQLNSKSRCLYIHIPFCRVRCTFCNFFQYASKKSMIEEYFHALLKELKWKAKQPWTQAASFQAVYIGGGTPTDLSPEQIKQLGQAIGQYFPLSNDCEITLEGRINKFTDKMFDYALEGGFNRFSFGVQSFNTKVRRAAKRLDDREVVMQRLQSLSKSNQAPIVIDLLFGLPYQTLDIWKQDLEDFLETGVQGVDLYQLIELNGMPMVKMAEQQRLPPSATSAEKSLMFKAGVHFMDKHHISRLSVNHWATDKRERSLYNSLAKTDAEVLPVGCGAGGNIGGFGLMQQRKLEQYIESVNTHQHALAMMTRETEKQFIYVAIKVAFDHGVLSKNKLFQQCQFDIFSYCLPLFRAWQKNGLVKLEDEYLTLTLAGQFWATTLAQNLITVLQNNEHSFYQKETVC